jgi:hypothetical protein
MQTERACAGANVPLYMRKCCLSKGTWCLYEGFGMVVIQRYRTRVKGTGLGLNSANQHQRRMSAIANSGHSAAAHCILRRVVLEPLKHSCQN